MCENYGWMEWLLRECDWDEVVDAVEETMQHPWEDISSIPKFSFREETLQDAYICLDFMPDPPELPECQE